MNQGVMTTIPAVLTPVIVIHGKRKASVVFDSMQNNDQEVMIFKP